MSVVMKCNVGSVERAIRAAIGVALLAIASDLSTARRIAFAILGVIGLGTAAIPLLPA